MRRRRCRVSHSRRILAPWSVAGSGFEKVLLSPSLRFPSDGSESDLLDSSTTQSQMELVVGVSSFAAASSSYAVVRRIDEEGFGTSWINFIAFISLAPRRTAT